MENSCETAWYAFPHKKELDDRQFEAGRIKQGNEAFMEKRAARRIPEGQMGCRDRGARRGGLFP